MTTTTSRRGSSGLPGELLLDTHALLWWKASSDRLSTGAARAIEAADALFVSAVSFWEVATLARLGRIDLDRPAATWAADIVDGGVNCIDISARIAAVAGAYEGGHGDPADRLILASASLNRLTLMTKDRRLSDMAVAVGAPVIW